MTSLNTLTILALIFLHAFTSATPLEPRPSDTQLLINDLYRLDCAIRNITFAARDYTGGAEGYQPIRNSFRQVDRTNRRAYNRAMRMAPLDERGSQAIVTVVKEKLAPDIADAVDALMAKRYLINTAGMGGETADSLNNISRDHDALSLEAVAPKLTVSTLAQAAVPALAMDLEWREGVLAFGGEPWSAITI